MPLPSLQSHNVLNDERDHGSGRGASEDGGGRRGARGRVGGGKSYSRRSTHALGRHWDNEGGHEVVRIRPLAAVPGVFRALVLRLQPS